MRTDIHRPGSPEFNPEDYTLIGYLTLHPSDDMWMNLSVGEQHYMLETGRWMAANTPAPHQKPDRCGHCGHVLNHANVLQHVPTGQYITVGADCIERFHMTAGEYDAWRSGERRKIEREAQAETLATYHPSLAILADLPAVRELGSEFLIDLALKFREYGSLTENQQAAAVKAIERQLAWKAERDARKAESTPAPEGRVRVTGEVLSIKDRETEWGTSWKMTVRDDRKFTVWATIPESFDPSVGDRVTFVATLTPAPDDPTFAFGKRPSKCEIVTEATPVQAIMAVA